MCGKNKSILRERWESRSDEEPLTWDIRGFVDEVWPEEHLKRQVKCLQSRGLGCVCIGQGWGRAAQLSREDKLFGV